MGVKRWYTCECDNDWCREQFYMSVVRHRLVMLSNARMVLPGHTSPGDRVRLAYEGVLIIEGGA